MCRYLAIWRIINLEKGVKQLKYAIGADSLKNKILLLFRQIKTILLKSNKD